MAKFYTPSRLSENIRGTPEGFLFCLEVPIARTGYQTYADGETPLEVDEDGQVEVYRSPEEVFRPQTIASFQGKSITIKHPEQFVSPDNWAQLSKGIVQNVRKAKERDENGEEILLADLLITDAMTINLVKSGLREVSCGYEAEYEQTGKGKGRQINIIGNHVALVEQGRAGEAYAINDHKGKVKMSNKIADKIKTLMGKVVDEAMESEKEEKKESKDAPMYDELVKAVKDMGEMFKRIEGFVENKKAKDEEKKDDKEMAKDDMKMEERLKALEAAVAKLLEKQAGDEDMEKKDDKAKDAEEMEGEEGEESQSKDDDYEESSMSGDSAEKLAKRKAKKSTGLEGTKDGSFEVGDSRTEPMTAEKMNEVNAAHWAAKR